MATSAIDLIWWVQLMKHQTHQRSYFINGKKLSCRAHKYPNEKSRIFATWSKNFPLIAVRGRQRLSHLHDVCDPGSFIVVFRNQCRICKLTMENVKCNVTALLYTKERDNQKLPIAQLFSDSFNSLGWPSIFAQFQKWCIFVCTVFHYMNVVKQTTLKN